MVNEIIKRNGSTYGLITGLILSLITLIKYSTDLNLFITWWPTLLGFGIFIFVPILGIIKTKVQLKNNYIFKDVFTTYFISILIGLLISLFFEIILFNLIDPSLKKSLVELSIEYIKSTSSNLNVTDGSLNEMIKNLKKTDPFAPAEQIKGAVVKLFFLTIIGLITAAFFKSKPSLQDNK